MTRPNYDNVLSYLSTAQIDVSQALLEIRVWSDSRNVYDYVADALVHLEWAFAKVEDEQSKADEEE